MKAATFVSKNLLKYIIFVVVYKELITCFVNRETLQIIT